MIMYDPCFMSSGYHVQSQHLLFLFATVIMVVVLDLCDLASTLPLLFGTEA